MREEDSHALSSGLLAFVGVGYLATLAIGIVLFKARPFVGGLAAIVAIAFGRALQLVVKAPVVTRRSMSAAAAVTPAAAAPAAPAAPAASSASPPG
jgi:hypothetical protein